MERMSPSTERERTGTKQDGKNGKSRAAAKPKDFQEVLSSLVNRKVVLADPESLEEAPLGYTLTTRITPAKVLRCVEDCLCVARVFAHQRARRQGEEEVIEQWIPFSRIKRVSVMKSQIVLHL